MADFIKLNVKDGGEIYVCKFTVTYLAKNKDGGTFICFSSPQLEENNNVIVNEQLEEIINMFNS